MRFEPSDALDTSGQRQRCAGDYGGLEATPIARPRLCGTTPRRYGGASASAQPLLSGGARAGVG